MLDAPALRPGDTFDAQSLTGLSESTHPAPPADAPAGAVPNPASKRLASAEAKEAPPPAQDMGADALRPCSFTVAQAELPQDDPTLIRVLKPRFPGLSGQKVLNLIRSGKVQVNGHRVLGPTFQLRPGMTVEVIPSAPSTATDHRRALKVYHIDAQVVVSDKPSGILTLPQDDEPDSLLNSVMKLLPRLEKKGRVHALRGVHRLDKEASGLVVLTRDIRSQRQLQEQFSQHTVTRIYLALVMGQLRPEGRFKVESILVPDRGDGLKGSAPAGSTPPDGKHAVTWFTVLERFPDCTLVRCELETGRTHQIRIHLAEMGHPMVGEAVYIREWRGRLGFKPPRLCLHAALLAFDHPRSGERLTFESPLPRAMSDLLTWLRRRG